LYKINHKYLPKKTINLSEENLFYDKYINI
jgi:hypothetical protein